MELKETYDLAVWFVENEQRVAYLGYLDDSIKRITSASGIPQEMKDEIYDSLLATSTDISTKALTKAQKSMLVKLNVDQLLGEDSKNHYSNMFHSGQSLQFIVQSLGMAKRYIQTAKQLFTVMVQTIPKITDTESVLVDEAKTLSDGEASLRVTFQGDASISDMAKLNHWAKTWFSISRGFALATHRSPEDIRISGAGNGSIFFDIIANIDTVNLMTEAIGNLLNVGVKLGELYVVYIGIQKLREEAKSEEEKVAYESSEKVLKAQLEAKKQSLYQEMAEEMLRKNKASVEHVPALAKAIRELDLYLKKGGDIACLSYKTDLTEGDIELELLEHNVKQIHNNKQRLLLEDKLDPHNEQE
jgi:hypothetical protein